MSSQRKLAPLKGKRTAAIKKINKLTDDAKGLHPFDSITGRPKTADYDQTVGVLTDLVNSYEKLNDQILDIMAEKLDDDDAAGAAQLEQESENSVEIVTNTRELIHELTATKNRAIQQFESQKQDQVQQEEAERKREKVKLDQERLKLEQLRFETEKERKTDPKLPELPLMKFNGDRLKWKPFWSSHVSTIHNNKNMAASDKMNYLIRCLQGPALELVGGHDCTNENYQKVVDLLEDEYGGDQRIVNAHYSRLKQLKQPQSNIHSLVTFRNTVETHFRELESLGENLEQSLLISMMRGLLPSHIHTKFKEKLGDSPWSIKFIRAQLKSYVKAREETLYEDTEKSSGSEPRGPKKAEGHSNPGQGSGRRSTPGFSGSYPYRPPETPTGAGLVAAPVPKFKDRKCVFCGKDDHPNYSCPAIPDADSRTQHIQKLQLCFCCFRDNHQAKDCRSRFNCWYCDGRHNSSLCRKEFPAKKEQRPMRPRKPEPTSKKKANGGDHVSIAAEQNVNCMHTSVQVQDPALFSAMRKSRSVLLQTSTSEIRPPGAEKGIKTQFMLDSCSGRTYIKESLARKLNLKKISKEIISVFTFASKTPVDITSWVVLFEVVLKDGEKVIITANTTPSITGFIKRPKINLSDSKIFCNQQELADKMPDGKETEIEVLLGADYFWDMILPEKRKSVPDHPHLYWISSKLGWLLSGRVEEDLSNSNREDSMDTMMRTEVNQQVTSLTMFTMADECLPVKVNFEDLWLLETIGIRDPIEVSADDRALEKFNETIKFEENRYQVTLPWDENQRGVLPANKELALGRFKSQIKRLKKDVELLHKVDDLIHDQLKKGIQEVVPKEEENPDHLVHYIPHHAVVTPQKETTKVREVYDASAKSRKGNLSLNECLLPGPIQQLMNDLCGILLRFRLSIEVWISDVEKAFLNVGLQMPDRDVTRSFWLKDVNKPPTPDNIQILRFCRVPFGLNCSPSLLALVLTHHLQQVGTELAKNIQRNLYVDNVIIGTSSKEEALQVYQEAKKIFSDISMNLREWSCNSAEVENSIPENDRASGDVVKVLGIIWEKTHDILKIAGANSISLEVTTKREVLRNLALIFDPLGFFTPITLQLKLLFQSLWKMELNWDDNLDPSVVQQWKQVAENAQQIAGASIPRYIGTTEKSTKYMLHCFTDASEKAFSAAVYLRVENQQGVEVNLLMSRCRLAPIKKELTIPRLELAGVLIGTRLQKFVQQELDLPLEKRIIWTDSQCALYWIANVNGKPLTTFVENRVVDIRKSKDTSFRYINTKLNPADCATRGLNFKDLMDSELWWHGPEFLKQPPETWPTWNVAEVNEESLKKAASEVKGNQILFEVTCQATVLVESSAPFEMKGENFSECSHLHRVTAWCLRFVLKLKKEPAPSGKFLTAKEIQNAKYMWELHVQESAFKSEITLLKKKKSNQLINQLSLVLDEDGLIKTQGRLGRSELSKEAQLPKLLPRQHWYTNLVIQHVHKKVFHMRTSTTLAHLRMEYWVPSGRMAVQKTIAKCGVCRRFDGGPYKYPRMPPLPAYRVVRSRPFGYTGLDYLGPLFIKTESGTQKVWVCLLTCFAVRAVHYEVVLDMTAEQFILALRRFISRRGKPTQITSDNAQQFKLAERTLTTVFNNPASDPDIQSYLSNEGIKWHFIPELSPWMGGAYERQVGTCKKALRKAIGRKALTLVQLQTILMEIEAVINSRPLTYVGNDVADMFVLTPAHFLTPCNFTGTPQLETEEDEDYQDTQPSSVQALINSWKRGQKQLNEFWRIWREQYLTSLRERTTTQIRQGRILAKDQARVGDVVLIKDNLPRGAWKVGRIQELDQSSDGEFRSAKVMLPSKNIITRPLNLLYPLECSGEPEKREQQEPAKDGAIATTLQDAAVPDADDEPSVDVTTSTRIPRRAAIAARKKIAGWVRDIDTEAD